MKKAPFILSILISLVFIFSCRTPMQPEFKGIDNVKFEKLGDNRARFSANALFHNPNVFGATITKVHLNVLVDSIKVSSMDNDTLHIKVKPHSDFTLPVRMEVSLKDILSGDNFIGNAISLLSGNKIHVMLQGYIGIKVAGREFKVPINSTSDIHI